MKSITSSALIWTASDLARHFGVSRSTVYRMVKDDRIPPPRGTEPWPTWRREDIKNVSLVRGRISLAQAATVMRVSRPTVYEWVQTGQLPEPRRDRRGQFWYRGEIEPAMFKILLTRFERGGNKG